MTITNKDELLEAWTSFIVSRDTMYEGNDAALHGIVKKEVVLQFDWLSEQGFALVSKEPTEATIDSALKPNSKWIRDFAYLRIKTAIKAANRAGDILTKPRGSE